MGITDYLIKRAVQVAVLLAFCGELKSTTLFFIEQALIAQKRGLVSLSDLNYQLQGEEKSLAGSTREDAVNESSLVAMAVWFTFVSHYIKSHFHTNKIQK